MIVIKQQLNVMLLIPCQESVILIYHLFMSRNTNASQMFAKLFAKKVIWNNLLFKIFHDK